MVFVYVTGISGSGKSTVRRALVHRGFDARDVGEDGFKSWFGRAADIPATEQKRWADTTVEWRRRYWLKIDRSRVQALAEVARRSDRPVFLCGVTPNDGDVWDLFDLVVHLAVTNEVLRERLASRTDNDYGKHPDDLADILGWNTDAAERNQAFGAVLVDAERPLAEVVDAVLLAAEGVG